MSPIRLGPHDLLEYDARYGVLICRECQYAIQKSALQSHLLRHKIYRDERQRLLSSIAQLDLFEPDHVPLPDPASPPIDALPIISGYSCNGCGNLCASTKRMRRHQSEIHGLNEPGSASSFARPVKLQTFFRGTKLRYFEITPSLVPSTAGAAPLATTNEDEQEDDEDGRYDGEELDEKMHDVRTPCEIPLQSSTAGVNLETLTYFHHFITSTCLTLPRSENTGLATHYWQTNVVLQALQRRWLMCGLLAISACHLAALADDTSIEWIVHRERSAQFLSEFSAGWEETTNHDFANVEKEAKKAGGQIGCILRCAHWAASPSPLQSIMTTIRGFAVWSDVDDGQEDPFAQAGRILDAGSFSAFTSSDNNLSALLNRLDALPSRMAEALGKPESTQGVLATLSAIAALVDCCACSFASDEAGTTWWAITKWLTKVSDHFNLMVSRHSPAALVVLAHWAVLVKRAEHCGCWFLSGTADTISMQIIERLRLDDRVQSLIAGLEHL